MLYASGMTRRSACIYRMCTYDTDTRQSRRIRCNRHLRGLNRCPSGYPLLLATSGMTLADLHAYITLKLQIELTVPQYVVYHPIYISYSVCRYYRLHCPPPVYTLIKASRSVTTLEPVGLRQATGGTLVTPVSAVTRVQLQACA